MSICGWSRAARKRWNGNGAPSRSIKRRYGDLGKVIALEHPELHCRSIDLDGAGLESDGAALFEEIYFDRRGGSGRVCAPAGAMSPG